MKKSVFFSRLLLPLFFIFLTNTQYLYAQEECGEESEILEEEEAIVDVGEEGPGELFVDGADLVGTEAAEGVAEGVGEGALEIGVEAAGEISAEALGVSFSEAIPVVGQLIGVALAIYSLVELILKIEHAQLVAQEKEEARILSSGEYMLPIFPEINITANDLNGKKDTISYVIDIQKNINKQSIAKYLGDRKLNKEQPLSKPLSKLSNHVGDTFTVFRSIVREADGGDFFINGVSIPIIYRRSVPEISIFQTTDSIWEVSYKSKWSHKIEDLVKYEGGIFTSYDLATTYEKNTSFPLELWLATKNERGHYEYLSMLKKDDYHIEDFDNKITLRVKNFDISRFYRFNEILKQDLFLIVRTKHPDDFVYNDRNHRIFPENWNPRQDDERFTLSDSRIALGNVVRVSRSFPDWEEDYYPNSKNLEPKIVESPLISFLIHDYQPRDTKASIQLKNALDERRVSTINPFPTIYNVRNTQFHNTEISEPEFGKSHLRVDIPMSSDWKKIKFVEIISATSNNNVIISIEDIKQVENTIKGKIKVNHHSVDDDGLPLSLKRLSKVSGGNNTQEEWELHELHEGVQIDFLKGDNYFLIENAPINEGEVINIQTYYEDNSLSKKLSSLSGDYAADLERAYYRIQANNELQLSYTNNQNGYQLSLQEEEEDLKVNWLIEQQLDGTFAIQNRRNNQVLGFYKGTPTFLEWNPEDINQKWELRWVQYNQYEIYNLGSKSFLFNQENEISYRYKTGTSFLIQKVLEAPEIILPTPRLIYHIDSNKVVAGNSNSKPALEIVSEDSQTAQLNRIVYVGCLSYVIINADDEYLLDEDNELKWDTDTPSLWGLSFEKGEDDFFTINTNFGTLQSATNESDELTVGVSSYLNENNQFSFNDHAIPNLLAHYEFNYNVNDSSLNNHHGEAFNGVTYVRDSERGVVAQFDGVDDYVNTGFEFKPQDYDKNLTVSLWMKTSTWGTENATLINNGRFSISRQASRNKLQISNKDNQNREILLLGPDMTTGEWHHVVMVIKNNGENAHKTFLYLNNQLVEQLEHDTPFVNLDDAKNLLIGWNESFTERYYGGLLDDIKIWKKALTPKEIAYEYDPNLQKSDLLLHYNFEENFKDESVYKNNGLFITNSYDFTYYLPQRSSKFLSISGGTANQPKKYLNTNFNFNPWEYPGMSVSFWFNPNDATNDRGKFNLFSSPNWELKYNTDTEGIEMISTENSGESQTFMLKSENEDVKHNTWTHLALLFDSTTDTQKLYINGELSATSSQTTEVALSNNLRTTLIAQGGGAIDPFYGNLDDMKIWNRVLSEEEIQETFQTDRENEINVYIQTSSPFTFCGEFGTIHLNLVDTHPDHKFIAYSFDNGKSYKKSIPATSETSTYELRPGAYNVWARWADGTAFETYIGEFNIQNPTFITGTINQRKPQITTVHKHTSNGLNNGQIIFNFNEKERGNEFVIKLNDELVYSAQDNTKQYIVNRLAPGTYTPTILWNNSNCNYQLDPIIIEPSETKIERYQLQRENIPGTIQAEYYNEGPNQNHFGGENLNKGAYLDDFIVTGDSLFRNDDYIDNRLFSPSIRVITDTDSDEWLSYTLTVNETANYDIIISAHVLKHYINRNESVKIKLEIDNEELGLFELLDTDSDLTSFLPYPINNFYLRDIPIQAGENRILKLTYLNTTNNITEIDYIKFVKTSTNQRYASQNINIPGRILAINYDNGGEGVGYHDDNDRNDEIDFRPNEKVDIRIAEYGGQKVVNGFRQHEWLAYTVDVETSGLYDINLNTRNLTGNLEVALLVNDVQKGVFMSRYSNPYSDTTLSGIFLEAGEKQQIKIQFLTNYAPGLTTFRVNYIEFIKTGDNIALNKDAEQSSTYRNTAHASRAVDGNTNGNWGNNSISSTNKDVNAWWKVDLEAIYDVSQIEIFNRVDCCSQRLPGAQIYVGNTDSQDPTDYTLVGSIDAEGERFSFTVNATGRYVFVYLPKTEYLSLAEVEVYGELAPVPPIDYGENIALNKDAEQSSTYGTAHASRAVDDNTNGNWRNNSVTHTNNENNPKWQVDLENYYAIDYIKVFNRADCCAQRLNGAQIYVGNTDTQAIEDYTLVGTLNSDIEQSFTISAAGQYVMIYLPGTNKILSLAEVEVYGELAPPPPIDYGENIALNKDAEQSSTYGTAHASRAVDDNTNGNWRNNSVTHTNNENNPKWQVDLENYYAIDYIKVFNRADCCAQRLNGAQIYVGNTDTQAIEDYTLVGTLNSDIEQSFTISAAGQYVMIYLPGTNKILSLAEVEVYGELAPPPPIDYGENIALNKDAEQSSTYGTAHASRAVDDNTNGNWRNNSVTHTNNENNPKWQVDLENYYAIDYIKVFNRADCCAQRLNGAQIYVGNTDTQAIEDYTLVGTLNSDIEQSFTISAAGQYVMIYLPGTNKILSLAEVEVYGELAPPPPIDYGENIALNKDAEQSSTYRNTAHASRAVDGNTNGNWGNNSISSTNKDVNAWWKVDLEAIYDVSQIEIFNRVDCCSQRLPGAQIYVGNTDSQDPTDYTLVGSIDAEGERFSFTVNATGRYVFVYLPKTEYLSLAEVEVYGELAPPPPIDYGENIALNKDAEQSSTYRNTAHASRAVDGNTNGNWGNNSISSTNKDVNAWWKVDLEAIYDVSQIEIFNRVDCCPQRLPGAQIYVGNTDSQDPADYTLVGSIDAEGERFSFTVNVTGRYVFVYLPKTEYLSLAEVEVYGELAPPIVIDNRYSLQTSNIPGTIELEYYDTGGQDVSFNDDTSKDGDLTFRPEDKVDTRLFSPSIRVITDTDSDEWLSYTLTVNETTNYDIIISARVLKHYVNRNESVKVKLEIDNEELGLFELLDTDSDLTSFLPYPINNFYLRDIPIQAGENRILKLTYLNTTSNITEIDYIKFVKTSTNQRYASQNINIPGRILAINYDNGGEGVGYHDDNGRNDEIDFRPNEKVDIRIAEYGGQKVVNGFRQHEWLAYTVDVETSGLYDINLNTRNLTGNLEVALLINDVQKGVFMSRYSNSYSDTTLSGISLEAGEKQQIKIQFLTNYAPGLTNFRVNYIEFVESINVQAKPSFKGEVSALGGLTNEIIEVYPNPSDGIFTVRYRNSGQREIEWFVSNNYGGLVISGKEKLNPLNDFYEFKIQFPLRSSKGVYHLYIEDEQNITYSTQLLKN